MFSRLISLSRSGGLPRVKGVTTNLASRCLAGNLSQGLYFNKHSIRALSEYTPKKVRNVAIIAHVDHGKTTLMDKLLAYCGTHVTGERAMDSNEHEKERGITIMSKYTRLYYKEHALHVVDTPGHADFGGEVERILSMVDGVVLLVDASEGPMSQTKFVLSKALAVGKKPIVVLNKVDRDGHRADEVECEILELFCALTNKEELLNYPLLFASARQGWVTSSLGNIPGKDVVPLLDAIIEHIPASGDDSLLSSPFSMSVNTIQTDLHLGRVVTGKVETGSIGLGDPLKVFSRDGQIVQSVGKVTKLFFLEGLKRVDVTRAYAGEIVSLAGSDGGVADTVCAPEVMAPLATVPISPPIISMTFGPNDSPLAGKDGQKLTSSMIKDRLRKEVENNVALTLIPSSDPEALDVQGRGELQLGILVESMRREGYELTVSPPQVLPVNGQEPFEEVTVDVDLEYQGLIIDAMSGRKGVLKEFKDISNRCRLVFMVPSRGMMGFRHEILTVTRGNATVNSIFSHYDDVNRSDFYGMKKGKLVSMETGTASGYALNAIAERGVLFVDVGEEVYEGMIVGENSKSGDLDVNPCKLKKLSNVRSSGAEEKVNIPPPRRMTIEHCMSYMNEDEVLEVTPKNIRLRKRILESGARARYNKANKPK
ncbi:GTP-binding protein [archaeon]|nr:MAG: GTP-binding protein [archaeon]